MPHDGFISYSHGADGRLAPALQAGLQRFARPWYRRRALDIFRDDTGLSASPHLWTSIQTALDDSRYFVLMASPEAAASPWVQREIDHWLETKTGARLRILPVLTDGDLVWDDAAGDFDRARSTALPPNLRGQFEEEPRHVDLRWARDEEHLDLRHSRFRDAVADIAATIHGIPKDELEGQDVRRHRRAVRTAVAAVIVLVILTLAALTSSVLAVRAQRSSDRNAARADHQASVARANLAEARSRQLVSLFAVEPDPRMQVLLAVQANEFAVTQQSRAALLQSIRSYFLGEGGVFGFEQHPSDAVLRSESSLPTPISAGVELSRDAETAAVSSDDGSVALLDLARGSRLAELRATNAIAPAYMVVGPDDRTLAAQWDGEVVVATRRSTHRVRTGVGSAAGLAVSSDSDLLAVLTSSASDVSSDARLAIYELDASGRVHEVGKRSLGAGASDVQFIGRRRIALRTPDGLVELAVTPDGLRESRVVPGEVLESPGTTPSEMDRGISVLPGGRRALSVAEPGLSYFWSDFGVVDSPYHYLRVWDLQGSRPREPIRIGALNTRAVRLLVSADGQTMAVFVDYEPFDASLVPMGTASLEFADSLDDGSREWTYVDPGTTVQFYDVATLEPIGRPFTTTSMPRAAAFGPHTRSLVWVDEAATVHRVDLDVRGTWIPQACSLVDGELTAPEFRQYVGVPAGDQHRACAAPDR